MNFKKMLKFQKKDYSGIISFVYVGTEKIHAYMQYEVFMSVHMGRIANQRKVPIRHNHKIFDVLTLGTCGHIHTKYEVSISNPAVGRAAQRMMPTPTMTQDEARRTKHDCIRLFG